MSYFYILFIQFCISVSLYIHFSPRCVIHATALCVTTIICSTCLGIPMDALLWNFHRQVGVMNYPTRSSISHMTHCNIEKNSVGYNPIKYVPLGIRFFIFNSTSDYDMSKATFICFTKSVRLHLYISQNILGKFQLFSTINAFYLWLDLYVTFFINIRITKDILTHEKCMYLRLTTFISINNTQWSEISQKTCIM